jgi:cullin-associated NEDD8-dissociated protein 1
LTDVKVVRRLSTASLNAALQNKPHLIVDRLNVLQPLLYEETHVKKELQREVQMGPWKGETYLLEVVGVADDSD